jgi:hypothetical protein
MREAAPIHQLLGTLVAAWNAGDATGYTQASVITLTAVREDGRRRFTSFQNTRVEPS